MDLPYHCCRSRSEQSEAKKEISQRSSQGFANLLDPRFDSDSCGVGFVAQISGTPSHTILNHALTALARLEHRGAVAADGKSSDGVGVMTAIPRNLLLHTLGIDLAHDKPLGVAVVFLEGESSASRGELKAAFNAQQIDLLAWRPVPICPQILGS